MTLISLLVIIGGILYFCLNIFWWRGCCWPVVFLTDLIELSYIYQGDFFETFNAGKFI